MDKTIGIKESKRSNEPVERYDVNPKTGLTSKQVEERIEKGYVNEVKPTGQKTNWQIIQRNVFSFFNVLLYIIALAMIIVQYFEGLFFVVILVANASIGLTQDFRAKKKLQQLQIVAAQKVTVIRDGEEQKVLINELVLDDIVILKNGAQIPADSVVVKGNLQVNEALLTGESETIQKEVGSLLLGGSFVTSGQAIAQIDRVGEDAYVNSMQDKAKQFKRPKSRLLYMINRLFRFIGFIVIILGVLMIVQQIIKGGFKNFTLAQESIKSISGSMVSMIPAGMYLLTSMTLAVAVINLARRKTLVQESYAIEMLARVDVLCIDKTGTITDGSMMVKDVVPLKNSDITQLPYIMGSFLRATKDESPTTAALKAAFPLNELYVASEVLPFSSERKNSAVTFEALGTYILGASNFVLSGKEYEAIAPIEEEYMERGFRVMVLAHSKRPIVGSKLPSRAKAVALIVIQDRIRPYVYDTLQWFRNNGVLIKVISGDHPTTVSEICHQVGVVGAEHSVSLAGKSDQEVRELALINTVFGRVSPDQKEVIVRSLQDDGKTVAMVGDGVNDILALKNADCSIAMGKGAEATQAVSHIVLLNNDFNAIPNIVKEGRRVINNLQRTWSLFLVKTVFAMILTILFLFSDEPYPLTTQNMYIWEVATIGVASFFLSMQPNYNKVKGDFHSNVTRKSVPAAVVMVLLVLSFYLMYFFERDYPGSTGVLTKEVATTLAVLTMNIFSFIILFRISWPFNLYRGILYGVILVLTSTLFGVIAGLGNEYDVFGIRLNDMTGRHILIMSIVLLIGIGFYWVMDRAFSYPIRDTSKYYDNEKGDEYDED